MVDGVPVVDKVVGVDSADAGSEVIPVPVV